MLVGFQYTNSGGIQLSVVMVDARNTFLPQIYKRIYAVYIYFMQLGFQHTHLGGAGEHASVAMAASRNTCFYTTDIISIHAYVTHTLCARRVRRASGRKRKCVSRAPCLPAASEAGCLPQGLLQGDFHVHRL